jgi:leucyl-tRNA synthetase
LKQYLVESSKEYPISFNGKMRFTWIAPKSSKDEIEGCRNMYEKQHQYLEGRTPVSL